MVCRVSSPLLLSNFWEFSKVFLSGSCVRREFQGKKLSEFNSFFCVVGKGEIQLKTQIVFFSVMVDEN